MSGGKKNAGTYEKELVPSGVVIKKGDQVVTGNYDLTLVEGNLTINKRGLPDDPKGPVQVTPKDQTYTYNGSVQGPQGEPFEDGEIGDHATWTTLEGSDVLTSLTIAGGQTDVGAYPGELIPSGAELMNGDEDVSDNYHLTLVAGNLTILPRPILLTANHNLGIIYDGELHGEKGYVASDIVGNPNSGLVGGQEITVKIDGSEKDAGFYPNKLAFDKTKTVITAGGVDVTANYDIGYDDGNLQILRKGLPPIDPPTDPEDPEVPDEPGDPEDPENPEPWRVVIDGSDLNIVWGEDIAAKLAEAITNGSMATALNLVGGHTLQSLDITLDPTFNPDIDITGEGVYVGKIVVSNAVIFDENGKDVTKNYFLTYINGDLNVTAMSYTVHYYTYDGGPTTTRVWEDRAVTGVKVGEIYTEYANAVRGFTYQELYSDYRYYVMSNTSPRYRIRPDSGAAMLSQNLTVSLNPAENEISFYFAPRVTVGYTIYYIYNGNPSMNTSETVPSAELDQVISDISPRVLANTVSGYTVERIEGLPLTIRSDRGSNVINVYYEPQIYVTILDLEVPTGASLGGLNVGDCSE
ncbi:MAG: hypothetical protein GX592_06210 [Clostridiales bacterium]|nr:hypothetical protein [Clostridiales bacterium]